VGTAFADESGDVPTENVGVTGERVIGFVDGISIEDGGNPSDPGLRVDNGVTHYDGAVSVNSTGNVEISEEDEDIAREFPFDLYGAEETGRIPDMLASSDEDVLAKVGAAGRWTRRGWHLLMQVRRALCLK